MAPPPGHTAAWQGSGKEPALHRMGTKWGRKQGTGEGLVCYDNSPTQELPCPPKYICHLPLGLHSERSPLAQYCQVGQQASRSSHGGPSVSVL